MICLKFSLTLASIAVIAGTATAQTVAARPKIAGVSHLSVYTSDAAKAETFYVHDLGATKGADPQNPAGVRFYFSPVQFVEVLPLPPNPPANSRFDHAGYNTADAEAMRRYLAAHKVDVPAAVMQGSDGSKYFEVKDPEGNRVQFVQPPAHPPAIPQNPLSSHIIHVGYIVHNSALEDTFYKDMLGFRPYWHGGAKEDSADWISSQVPDGLDWVEFMVVKASDAVSLDKSGVLDHFALGMQNAEQAMNMLYNGDRLSNKHSDPKIGRDGKWQINMYDPDGTRAELMEFQPVAKPCCSPFTAESPMK
jgi:catechol 2,3-dioxygenase-like lactoylglutathione lyase family enzyme